MGIRKWKWMLGLTMLLILCGCTEYNSDVPSTPSPTFTNIPTPTPSPTPTNTPTPTPSPTPTNTPTPTPSSTPTNTPTPTPSPTPTNTPTPTPDLTTYITDNFKWKNKSDGTVVIVGIDKSAKEAVVIPSEIEGKIVSEIGTGAFTSNEMSSVVISDNVEKIGGFAFWGCDNLVSVRLPSSLTTLGEDVFCSCESLEEIQIEGNEIFYVEDGVLFNKPEKKLVKVPDALDVSSYRVPDGIEIIGNSAFDYCSKISKVVLPNSVITLENDAFARCAKLKTLQIPETVTYIGRQAFWSCGLEKIIIPDGVMYIGDYAFCACRILEELVIENNENYYVEDGVLFDKNTKTLLCMPGNSSIKNYKVPDGIEHIGDYAFSQCNNLVSIEFPDSLVSIGVRSFMSLTFKLQSATIPASVTKIGEMAFSSCSKLTIYAPEGSYAEQYAIQNKIPVDNP